MTKILIVEDDGNISKSLKMHLSFEGFDVSVADRINAAWQMIAEHTYDVLLLDVNLPDGSGIDLCEKIRGSGKRTPILFLSANVDEESVVRGINTGGDDYLRKPFGMEELKARMNKILNRNEHLRNTVSYKDLTIDLQKREVRVGDLELVLNRREFDILTILANKPEEVVTREFILSHLNQDTDAFDRVIDSHISHLRKKLRAAVGEKLVVLPVYGVGYRLKWK